MAVVNVRTSLLQTIDDIVEYWKFDITVNFNQPYRLGRLELLAKSVPGVQAVEGWGSAGSFRIRPDGSEGEDIYLEAPPAGSTMINPTVVQGRWLLPGDENALVVSASLLTDEPDLRVGGPLTLDINGEETTWNIVGAVRIAQPVPFAYTNYDYLASLIGGTGRVSTLDITTDRHDPAYRTQVAEALEAVFTDAGLNVGGVQTISQIRASIEVLFNIIITLLMSMVILLAIVGAIGLAGTMSLNVLERIREIGVLRAIGASNGAVLQVVIVEGVLIGMLSWAIGALLALPVGKVIASAIGKVTLNADVSYTVSIAGIFLWLAIVTVISAVASFFPAQQAADLSVREVLAYEQ
jgi:putative ABC transport system permease protein